MKLYSFTLLAVLPPRVSRMEPDRSKGRTAFNEDFLHNYADLINLISGKDGRRPVRAVCPNCTCLVTTEIRYEENEPALRTCNRIFIAGLITFFTVTISICTFFAVWMESLLLYGLIGAGLIVAFCLTFLVVKIYVNARLVYDDVVHFCPLCRNRLGVRKPRGCVGWWSV